MTDKIDTITTMAEVIAMLVIQTYLIVVRHQMVGVVVSHVALDEEVLRYAYNAFYLPPLIIRTKNSET